MGYDKICKTCRYHVEGKCYCQKSNEFRDVTADTHHCRKYRRDWEQDMTEAFMKGARR